MPLKLSSVAEGDCCNICVKNRQLSLIEKKKTFIFPKKVPFLIFYHPGLTGNGAPQLATPSISYNASVTYCSHTKYILQATTATGHCRLTWVPQMSRPQLALILSLL